MSAKVASQLGLTVRNRVEHPPRASSCSFSSAHEQYVQSAIPVTSASQLASSLSRHAVMPISTRHGPEPSLQTAAGKQSGFCVVVVVSVVVCVVVGVVMGVVVRVLVCVVEGVVDVVGVVVGEVVGVVIGEVVGVVVGEVMGVVVADVVAVVVAVNVGVVVGGGQYVHSTSPKEQSASVTGSVHSTTPASMRHAPSGASTHTPSPQSGLSTGATATPVMHVRSPLMSVHSPSNIPATPQHPTNRQLVPLPHGSCVDTRACRRCLRGAR